MSTSKSISDGGLTWWICPDCDRGNKECEDCVEKADERLTHHTIGVPGTFCDYCQRRDPDAFSRLGPPVRRWEYRSP